MAGTCRIGDALGVVDGDFALITEDLTDGRDRGRRPVAGRWWRADDGGPRREREPRTGRRAGPARAPEPQRCRCRGVRRRSGEVPVADRGGMKTDIDRKLRDFLGAKTAKIFADVLGIETVGELLRHYPRRYLKKGELTPFDELQVGDQATVSGRVKKVTVRSLDSKMEIQPERRQQVPAAPDDHQGGRHRRPQRPRAGVLQPALAGQQADRRDGRPVLGRGDDVPRHHAAEEPGHRDPRRGGPERGRDRAPGQARSGRSTRRPRSCRRRPSSAASRSCWTAWRSSRTRCRS